LVLSLLLSLLGRIQLRLALCSGAPVDLLHALPLCLERLLLLRLLRLGRLLNLERGGALLAQPPLLLLGILSLPLCLDASNLLLQRLRLLVLALHAR